MLGHRNREINFFQQNFYQKKSGCLDLFDIFTGLNFPYHSVILLCCHTVGVFLNLTVSLSIRLSLTHRLSGCKSLTLYLYLYHKICLYRSLSLYIRRYQRPLSLSPLWEWPNNPLFLAHIMLQSVSQLVYNFRSDPPPLPHTQSLTLIVGGGEQ